MTSPLPNPSADRENVPTPRPGAAIARFGMTAATVVFFAVAGLFLLVREVVVPRMHEFRPQIVAVLEHAIGLPVSIDALSADWSGLRPRLHLSGLSILDANGESALRLDRVDATLAWSSLLRGQAHFDRLVLNSPELALKREPDGQVFVAGVRIDPHASGGGLPDWLLAQREVVILGATVTWSDALRGAPALRLSDVDFRLFRHGARYRFGIRSNPPAEIAAMLDVRGDLVSVRPGDPATWAGRIYVALDSADLGAWRTWVDYPVPFEGLGGLRAWIDVIDGMPRILTANVALDDVSTRLSDDLPELRLNRVRGSFSGKRVARGYEFTMRSMTLAGDDDLQLGPTDLDLTIRDIADLQQSGGAFKASTLDIGVLASLAAHLPFGDELREGLETFGPSGTLQDLSFEWNGQGGGPSWSARTRFSGLGLSPHGIVPGIQGFSGEFAGDHDSGRFSLAGSDASIDLPAVFPEPRLAFTSIHAEGGWTRRSGRLEFMLDGARFENADAAGSASGRYFPVEAGRGEIDFAAQLTRAEGPSVWRYLPWVVNEYTRDWLRSGLTGGFVPDARLRLKGNLDEFPFEDGQAGQFLVTVRVAGASLNYAAGWPAIGAIDAELRFEGPGMRISADRASILGVTLANVVAEVPHLDEPGGAVMHIQGSAMGPTQEFLRFVSSSPVAARIDGFIDHMTADGRGTLDLALVMPLGDIDATRVAGEFRFTGNRIGVIEGLPALSDATGRVRFTRDELSITDARARALGEPLRLSAHTPRGGGVRFLVEGGAAMRALTQFLDWPILSHLSGTAAWKAEIDLRPKLAEVVVTSPLTGVSSSLPYPFNKRAGAAWPLKAEMTMSRDGTDESIRVELGDIGTGELIGRRSVRGWEIERGGIGLFSPAVTAQGGMMLSAVLDELDLDAWRRVLGRDDGVFGDTTADGRRLIAGVDLSANRVRVLGREVTALELGVLGDGGGWKGRISSDQASGSFDWRSAGEGSLKARFERLTIGAEEDASLAGDALPDEPLRNLPALDIVADSFMLRGMDLGRLELEARNEDGLWALNTLRIDNPEGEFTGSGQWRSGRNSLTELAFRLETGNIGRLLARLGYPEAVRGGNAILSGGIEWRGAPTRIDHPSLSGTVALEAYKGQFRKLEPGVGRLLGVLSLQSLPRRLTLDFRDVFSEGFAFESISGSIAMASGVMRTDDLRIAGPAARIWITGSADVEKETQNLAVLVQPTLSESVAVGAAAGLINPMAGVIAYLAQKVLSDPFERMFAFGYAITGSWADPVVEKVPVGPQSQQDGADGEQ